jgi:hypothetical protein
VPILLERHKRMRLSFFTRASAAAILLLLAQAGNLPAQTALDAGFRSLYNLQFEQAHAEFDRWMQEHPEDPLGPASHASAYLFQELNRLGILESGFLKDDKQLTARTGAKPDLRLRAAFYEQLRNAEAKSRTHLSRNPLHQNSLLALTIVYGSEGDYLNLVEKRPVASLSLFKKSNKHAQELLKLNPTAYDAWTASGFTEYLAGSLPFYARWFVRFDAVKGKKTRGIEQLQLAAVRGRYLRPFAKILLAVISLREGRPAESARWLAELHSEFPRNPLFAIELAKLNGRGVAR